MGCICSWTAHACPAALVAEGNDLAPADFAKYCDVFYIGGTKNGLLFGEALVITNDSLKPHFRNMIKQRGGMFAKGFLFGTQFKAYFEDDLWLTMARHAVTQAQRIQKAAAEKGYSLYAVSPTNQVFLVLSHAQIERLKQNFAFELNGRVDEDHEAARFVCSWADKARSGRRTDRSAVMDRLSHPFPPLYDAESRILILGSFPSVKSRGGHVFLWPPAEPLLARRFDRAGLRLHAHN